MLNWEWKIFIVKWLMSMAAMLGRFLKEVLNNDDATLWHCAVGKDRCV